MKKTRDLVDLAIQAAVLVALAFGMVVLFRAVSRGGMGPLAKASPTPQASLSPTGIPTDIPYPPPEEAAPPQEATLPPTEYFIETTPGEFWPPTDTPWPTFTPYPSPTLRPGPTDTPIPLRKPASNASGNLIYFSRQTD